jgi:signal peptidase I
MEPRQTDQFWLKACEHELASGRSVGIKAKGLSMFPVISQKQEVRISSYPFEKLKIGQIIAFQRKTHIVVHRVIQIEKTRQNELTCQGDANWYKDEPVNIQNYIGLVDLNGKNEQQSVFAYVLYKPLISFFRIARSVASKAKQITHPFQPNK